MKNISLFPQDFSSIQPVFFLSCIAERVRDLVGQLLEIRKRCETLIDGRIITGHTKTKQTNKQTQNHPKPPTRPVTIRKMKR